MECIVEVGKILKVEKMFAGTIGKVGKIYTINIQVIDIGTAQIEQNKSRRHDGAIEDLLTDIILSIKNHPGNYLINGHIRLKILTSQLLLL